MNNQVDAVLDCKRNSRAAVGVTVHRSAGLMSLVNHRRDFLGRELYAAFDMSRQHLTGRHDFHDVRAAVDTDLLANRATGLVRTGDLARTEKHTARSGSDDRRARNKKARPRDDAVAKRAPHLERKVAPGARS